MAQPGDADQARGRLPVLASLLAFAATTAIAFGRVYRGGGSTLKLVVAAVAAVLIAAALERIHVLLSTLASALGLLLALGLLVFPETTAFGLPTSETIQAIRLAFSNVGSVAAREVAPVAPLAPLLLAGLVAVWTASFAAHALVARAASGMLALLPAGALIAFGDVVLEDGVRPAYMVLFLLSAFAMLSAIGLRSVVRWGRLVPWGRSPRWSLFSTNALRAARRAAVPAALSAVLLPWALPGLHTTAWWNMGRGNAPISIDPIVDLRPSLRLDPPRELFTVRTPKAAYWRMLALDEFDGRRWTSSNLDVDRGIPLEGGASLPTSSEFGVQDRRVRTTIRIDRLASPWLPVPYEPVFLDVPVDGLIFDDELSTIGLPEETEGGLEYVVIASIVAPEPSNLTRDFSVSDRLYAPRTRFTAIPNMPEVGRIARRITEGYDTPYLKALAIQNHLRKFAYDEDARPGHSTDYLVEFLTRTKRGYCEQFAGSMAVLLRALDIPSRVVVGFTPGSFEPKDGLYHVTTRNAHSWVEVHFGEYGWLPFEPTPSRSNPVASTYTNPTELPGGVAVPGRPETDPRLEGQGPRNEAGRQEDPGGIGPGELTPPETPRSMLGTWLALGAAVLLLGLVAIPSAKGVARRLTLARARGGSPSDRVLAAYDVLSRRLADLRLSRSEGETLWEYRDRIRERMPRLSEGQLERVTRLAGRAAYAGVPLTEEETREAAGLARRVASEARRSVSRATRLKATWRVHALRRARPVVRPWATHAPSWSAARL